MFKAKISGWGKYIPKKVLTNHDLEKMVETSDEWITTRTGIRERHIVAAHKATSDLATGAATDAIAMAGVAKEDIDMVMVATITPDMVFPATAALVQDNLKLPNAATMDLEAACSGFLYGLSAANAYIVSGMFRNVLVIGAECMSRVVDWEDRNTCVLFGDGAGAAVVSRASDGDTGEFLGFKLRGDGSYRDLLYLEAGGSKKPATAETVEKKQHFVKMNGNTTFKIAVRTMSEELEELMKEHNVSVEDVKLLIPHQANMRIIQAVIERLNFPMERTFVNLDKYGNTSAATIPIALTEANEQGLLRRGDLVACVAFGGGFTSGACLFRY